MKKFITTMAITIATTSVLGACSSNDGLSGKYVKSDDNKICYEYYDFKDGKNFENKNSSAVGGETSSGTFEVLDNGEIKFSYDGMGSDIKKFTFNKDKTEFKYKYNEGSKITCHYEKEDNS